MANERRLIDAVALKVRLCELCNEFDTDHLFIDAIIDEIDNSPTADAVEVIHCKGCKHMEITPDNLRWCNAWNSINGMGDKGYCNYGERKSGTQPQREDVCGSG